MNLTEHRLRMSFDPEYSYKYERLVANRRLSRQVLISSMRSKYLTIVVSCTCVFVYLMTKSLLVSLVFPVAVLTLESLLYLLWEDRKKRKELGI
jgi:hypothetical protein